MELPPCEGRKGLYKEGRRRRWKEVEEEVEEIED